jgi:hypothetical protein
VVKLKPEWVAEFTGIRTSEYKGNSLTGGQRKSMISPTIRNNPKMVIDNLSSP